MVKNIVSSSFSQTDGSFEKITYITKVGIYDKYKNLIAVADLANPVRKREQDSYTFKLKLDMWYNRPMILGLDISTSITGFTILDKEGEIVYNDALDTRKYKSMFEKARNLQEKLKEPPPQESFAASKSPKGKKQNRLL